MSTEQPPIFRAVAKSRVTNPEIVKRRTNLSQIQQQNGQGNHMCSCIFQFRRHQTHSTFPLSQAEFAFYVVRDDADFQRIWIYTTYNHLKWDKDCFFTP